MTKFNKKSKLKDKIKKKTIKKIKWWIKKSHALWNCRGVWVQENPHICAIFLLFFIRGK
jgi:hypothetical protein